jgi:hypothetical protein
MGLIQLNIKQSKLVAINMSIYLWIFDRIIKYIYFWHIPRFVKCYQGEICNIMQTKGVFFNYHGTWTASTQIIYFLFCQNFHTKRGLYVNRFENSIKVIRLQSTPYQQSTISFN